MIKNNINIKNRRATFDYEISETFTAGIVLTGTEIKSLRDSKASLSDSFCMIENGEVWVKGMMVSEYFYGSYNNHSSRRDRKLLLNKKEIAKLIIGIGRGKKQFDKRQAIKEREDKRSIDRIMKH